MIKKPLSLVLSLILMVLTAFPALANTNDMGITFIAELDKPTISVSAEAQTVVMTVKASEPILVDTVSGNIVVPDGWTVETIENEVLNFTTEDINPSKGIIAWMEPNAEAIETEILAKVTYSVPANTEPGEYELGIRGIMLTNEYCSNEWESDGSASVTLINKDFTVEAKGNINYTVSGRNITIINNLACKVGYLDANGKYVNILGVHKKDGSYKFTVPEDVSSAMIVVAGDINGDGRLNAVDKGQLNSYVLGKNLNLSKFAKFAGDINSDNKWIAVDKGQLNAAVLGKNPIKWNATEDNSDIVIEDTTGNEDTEKDNLGNKYTEIVW